MPNYLLSAYKSPSADVETFQFNGTTLGALGGPVDRATPITGDTQTQDSCHACHSFARAFRWVSDGTFNQIYLFDPDAYYVPVAGYGTTQAAFHAFAKGDTWSADGGATTGTFLEDGVATDTYVLVKFTTGSPNLNNGDTITITSGTANGETAVAQADATQRGDSGQIGEWGKLFDLDFVPSFSHNISGLFPCIVDGREQIVGLYFKSSGGSDFRGFVIDPIALTITETSLGVTGVSLGGFGGGFAHIYNDSMVWVYSHAIGDRYQTVFWNPSTNSFGPGISPSAFVTSNASQGNSKAYLPVLFRGRLFVYLPTSSGNDGMVAEFSGGGWAQLLLFDGVGGVSGNLDLLPSSATLGRAGGQLIEYGDKLWIVCVGDTNVGSDSGYAFIALSYLNNTLSADNVKTGSSNPIVAADAPEKLAQFLLSGSALAVGVSPGLSGNPSLRWVRDDRTNGFGGQSLIELWFISDHTGGNTEVKRWTGPYTTLGISIDWSTAVNIGGDTWEVDTSADPTAETPVDSWVVDPDNQIFRVSAINAGTPSIEIENPGGRTIQTVGSSNRKLNAFSSPGVSASVAPLALPNETHGAGGRVFTRNQKSAAITGFEALTSDERVKFKVNGGGTASFKAFHGEDSDRPVDTESTITNLQGGGSLVSNTVTNFPADGTTEGSVDHDLSADSLGDGHILRRSLEIQ